MAISRGVQGAFKVTRALLPFGRIGMNMKEFYDGFANQDNMQCAGLGKERLPMVQLGFSKLEYKVRLDILVQTYPQAPYYLGRWSNGPSWIEVAARQLSVNLRDYAASGATTGVVPARKFASSTIKASSSLIYQFTHLSRIQWHSEQSIPCILRASSLHLST